MGVFYLTISNLKTQKIMNSNELQFHAFEWFNEKIAQIKIIDLQHTIFS